MQQAVLECSGWRWMGWHRGCGLCGAARDGPAIETLARYGVLYSDLVALAGLEAGDEGRRRRPGAGLGGGGGSAPVCDGGAASAKGLAAVWDSDAATGAGADGARRG